MMLAAYGLYQPIWETNDDVAMSMVAHGYGLAAHPSTNLFFSSSVWGAIVQLIPTINGVLGYSVATVLVLFMAGVAILFFLLRLGVGAVAAIMMVALIMLRPILFPQFTINAGMLTIAAMLGLCVYARAPQVRILACSVLLLCVGYSIRNLEALAVMAVAAPFLPWKLLLRDRRLLWGVVVIIVFIAAQTVIDAGQYQTEGWKKFLEINIARSPFTDYGIGAQVKQSPALMQKYGLSSNDVDMLTGFFFIDPVVMSPPKLQAMLAELHPVTVMQNNIQTAIHSLAELLSPSLIAITLSALLLSVLSRDMRVGVAWLMLLAIISVFGLLGRGGQYRVLLPLISCVLAFAPLAIYRLSDKANNQLARICRMAAPIVMMMAVAFNTATFVPAAEAAQLALDKVQAAVTDIPSADMVAVWGGNLPFEYVYPVFAKVGSVRDMSIYPIGGFTYAPFSVSYDQEAKDNGFIKRLRSEPGIVMIANKSMFQMLDTWCQERFDGRLKTVIIHDGPPITIHRVWCRK